MKFSLDSFLLEDAIKETLAQYQNILNAKRNHVKLEIKPHVETEICTDQKVFTGTLSAISSQLLIYSDEESEIELLIEKSPDHLTFMASCDMLVRNITPSQSPSHAYDSIIADINRGLMLASRIAEIMGGSLHSEVFKKYGICIKLSWPFATLSTEDGLVPEKGKVLIVGGLAEMRNYVKEVLEEFYRVETAKNGVEAWEALKEKGSNIDLVVADAGLAEMDGFGLLEKIRTDDNLASMPVALLTSKSGKENTIKGLYVGVSDYITKPFTKEILLAHCSHLLNKNLAKSGLIEEDLNSADEHTPIEKIKPADVRWLDTVEKVFYQHVKNKYYNMIVLADELAISERQLRRKLKKLTGMSPVQYMNELKLHNARQMIERGEYATVSEISYAAGFDTPNYFSQLFKERYGVKPSQLL